MQKDKRNNIPIIYIGLAAMFLGRFFPWPAPISPSQGQLLSIFLGVLLLWMKVAIDWPSLLLLVALATLPELSFPAVLVSSFGSNTFVFLLFTFTLSYALSQTDLLKRIACFFLQCSWAHRGPWHFVFLYFLSILLIGAFISPTVLFFVYYPLLEEIYILCGLQKGEKATSMLMMGTVLMCGISSGITPIAHVFPLLAISLYETAQVTTLSYFYYMKIALPVGLLTAMIIFLAFRYYFRKDVQKLQQQKLIDLPKRKLTKEEKIILAVFASTVFFWVAPDPLSHLPFGHHWQTFFHSVAHFGTAMPPLVATVFLCAFSYRGKALLNLKEALAKGVSWPSLWMCAGTLALGSALRSETIGFNVLISEQISSYIGSLSALWMVFFFCLWAGIQTNLASNMVTVSLVSNALLGVYSHQQNLVLPLLISLVGMLSSFSFATPPAMPCVAVATASGYTNPRSMFLWGFLATEIAIVLSVLFYFLFSSFI